MCRAEVQKLEGISLPFLQKSCRDVEKGLFEAAREDEHENQVKISLR